MRVYHIVKDELQFAVGDIIQPRIYNLDNMNPKKRQIEKELEDIRKVHFHDFPSRLECLFVCCDMGDVEFWSMQKSDIRGKVFKILTLETSEPVFWFSADSYNMYFNKQRSDLRKACIEFWESNSNTGIDKMEDREGLTKGPAKIVEIRRAKITREMGLEIMSNEYSIK